MALTENQKKYLVLGTVGGAFALFVGSMIFGDSKATAAPMIGPPGTQPPAPGHHGRQRTKRRHDDGGDSRGYSRDYDRERDGDQENGRGEYGRKKHHHRGHRHDH